MFSFGNKKASFHAVHRLGKFPGVPQLSHEPINFLMLRKACYYLGSELTDMVQFKRRSFSYIQNRRTIARHAGHSIALVTTFKCSKFTYTSIPVHNAAKSLSCLTTYATLYDLY